jgi:hypothetical protein
MKKPILFILLCMLSVVSCKKDTLEPQPVEPCINITENHTYDTILPSDYLMTYPGSWWEYSNGDIDSCISWEQVIINASTESPEGCLMVSEDIKILPLCHFKHLIHGSAYYSFESRVFPNSDHTTTRHQRVIDTIPGQIDYHSTSSGSSSRTNIISIVDHLDSMEVGGVIFYDVIHVKESWSMYDSMAPGGPTYYNEYFYAKNVGAIRKIIGFHSSGSPNPETLDLVNFYIEPY